VSKSAWVRIVIVNYNAGAFLKRTVDSLILQTNPDFEVVIVDNASTDNSTTNLRISDDRFTITHSEINLGFAAGSNLGFKDAQTPWLATLNPDAFPEPDWIEALHEATVKYPTTAMFGSLLINANNPSLLDGCGDAYSFFGNAWSGGHGHLINKNIQDGECFSPCAAAAIYRRDKFEFAKGFDEKYFCYFEDVDLGFRLRLLGERCILISAAKVNHIGSAITGSGSNFSTFHGARNLIWTYAKCMPAALLTTAPILVIALAIFLISGRSKNRRNSTVIGLKAALTNTKQILDDRKYIQTNRSAPTTDIAKAMCWNLSKIVGKKIDLRPL